MKRTQRINRAGISRTFGRALFLKVIAHENAPTHPAVVRGIGFMEQNFDRAIQLKELVDISGMSRRGFIKAFNRHVGDTPAAVVRQMRIEHAKHLLVTEDLPLNELARRVGFRSANTFCVAFLRAVGMAPKKFQRQIWLTERRTQPKQFLVNMSGGVGRSELSAGRVSR